MYALPSSFLLPRPSAQTLPGRLRVLDSPGVTVTKSNAATLPGFYHEIEGYVLLHCNAHYDMRLILRGKGRREGRER